MTFCSLLFISLKLHTCMQFHTLVMFSVKVLLLTLNLPVRSHSLSVLLTFEEVISNQAQFTFYLLLMILKSFVILLPS